MRLALMSVSMATLAYSMRPYPSRSRRIEAGPISFLNIKPRRGLGRNEW